MTDSDWDRRIEQIRKDVEETDKLIRQVMYRLHRLEKAIEEGVPVER